MSNMGKGKIKAQMLAKAQDQLADRDEVRRIVQQQLMEHLEGGSFWSSIGDALRPVGSIVKNVASFIPHPGAQILSAGLGALGAGHGAGHGAGVGAGRGAGHKKTRKLSAKMKHRNALIKQLMGEHNMTLPQASKYIKENKLA